MSACHDRWYHFCVLVFMLPLLAQSSSSELNGPSQDAVSSWFLEQTLVFCTWHRKYLLWHSGSPTPVFLSTTLRIISACLVFGDWEGLLVMVQGCGLEKDRHKVINLNSSSLRRKQTFDWFCQWGGAISGVRKPKHLPGKFIDQVLV